MSKSDRLTSAAGLQPSQKDRKFERYNLNSGALVVTLGPSFKPEAEWWVRIINVSRGGVAFVCAEVPEENTSVLIYLKGGDNGKDTPFFAKIMHVGVTSGEWVRVGIQFFKMPPRVAALAQEYQARLRALAS